MSGFITNAQGNAFVQTTRDTPFEWLTCTGVGDVDIPQGELTPVYCPDPQASGRFMIDGFIVGDQGAGTYTLTKPLAGVYNFLLQQKCDFALRINWVCRGTREDHRNYEMAALLLDSRASRKGLANPVRGPEDSEARVNTNQDVNFTSFSMIYPLTMSRTAVSNLANANFVYFLPERCEDRCGSARGLCHYGVMGLDRDAGYLYDAEVKITTDGDTWNAAAVDPFTWGGSIESGLMLETVNGIRHVVFRGEAVPAAPPEAAFSDDAGATWTNVAIGAVVNIGVNACKLYGARIFVCCDDGYVYYSQDQAVNWTVVEAAAATTENLNDIAFNDDRGYGYVVGDNGVFLRSLDHGATWNLLAPVGAPGAGTNYLSIELNDKGQLFIGTNDGRLFRSEDDGVTWTAWVDHGGGSIDWIGRDNALTNGYVMAYIYNNATPVGSLYRTEDGGATWWPVNDMPTNVGLNGGFLCDPNTIVVVGNTQGGTTFIANATAT